MHEQIDLLNIICKIRMCQSEILKSTSQAPIGRHISNWHTIRSRHLSLSINKRRRRVEITHANMTKDLQGILALTEKHPF
jgi:hypothetical protein